MAAPDRALPAPGRDAYGGLILAGVAFMLAGAATGVAGPLIGWSWSGWVALHLAVLGGVSQLVLGASQLFVCAYLATDPPRARLLVPQRLLWPAGTLCIVLGVPNHAAWLTWIGAGLVVAALLAYALALRALERSSLRRAPWAARWYRCCALFLACGALLGAEMARGGSWAPGDLLSAHLVLNGPGWLGTAIVGTIHTFLPTLARAPLAFPRLQRPTFVAWITGVAALAAGYLLAIPALAAVGLLALSTAALMLTANVLRTVRAAVVPVALSARLLVAGQLFLGLGSALAAALAPADPSQPFDGAVREGLAVLLGAGWIGLTVGGSLLHLLPVLGGRPGRLPRPVAMPLVTRWLPWLAAGAVALAASGAFLELSAVSTLGVAGIASTFGAVALVVAHLSAVSVWSSFRRRLASHP